MKSEKWKTSPCREIIEYIKPPNYYYLDCIKGARNSLFKMKLPSQTWAREVHRLLRRGARNAERCPISVAVRKHGKTTATGPTEHQSDNMRACGRGGAEGALTWDCGSGKCSLPLGRQFGLNQHHWPGHACLCHQAVWHCCDSFYWSPEP